MGKNSQNQNILAILLLFLTVFCVTASEAKRLNNRPDSQADAPLNFGQANLAFVVTNLSEFDAALTTINANPNVEYLLVLSGAVNLSNISRTIPRNVRIEKGLDGRFVETANGAGLTVYGKIHVPPVELFHDFEPGDVKLPALIEAVYPQWFGARCDYNGDDVGAGGTDDYLAIQSAIKSAAKRHTADNSSAKVRIVGQCRSSRKFNVAEYVVIEGNAGNGDVYFGNSVLAFDKGVRGFEGQINNIEGAAGEGSSGLTIRNLVLKARGKQGTTADAIRSVAQVHLENVTILGFARNGVFIFPNDAYGNANGSTIKNLTVENVGTISDTPFTVSVTPGSNVLTCSNCAFDSTSNGTWVRLDNARQLDIQTVTVAGNTVTVQTVSNHNLVHTKEAVIEGLNANGMSGADGAVGYVNVLTARRFSFEKAGVGGTYDGSGGRVVSHLVGQLYYKPTAPNQSSAISINLVGAGEIRRHTNTPLNVTKAGIRTATMRVLGAGVNVIGDNAQVNYFEQINCKGTGGSCVSDEGNYGSEIKSLHSSGAGYFAVNVNPFDNTLAALQTNFANGSCEGCYIEGTGSSYPVNIAGDGYTYTGFNGAGFQYGSKGFFVRRSRVDVSQQSFVLGLPVNLPEQGKFTVLTGLDYYDTDLSGQTIGGNFQTNSDASNTTTRSIVGAASSYSGANTTTVGVTGYAKNSGAAGVAVAGDFQTAGGATQIGVRTNAPIYLTQTAGKIYMKSPDGACWELTVTNNGRLETASAACPPNK